jgi:hypothetical protein
MQAVDGSTLNGEMSVRAGSDCPGLAVVVRATFVMSADRKTIAVTATVYDYEKAPACNWPKNAPTIIRRSLTRIR